MRCTNGAIAHIDGRNQNLIRVQQIQRIASSRYICYRIQCTNFVEVYFFHRSSVRRRLCFCNMAIKCHRLIPNFLRQIKALDHVLNLR